MIDKINFISNKDEFVKFLYELSDDFILHKEEWKNTDISDYLERIATLIEDFSRCPYNDNEFASLNFLCIDNL